MVRAWVKIATALSVCAGLAAAAFAASATASSPHAVRLGAAPRLPTGTRTIGALGPGTGLDLTVTLKPRDPAGLEQYATAVATPGSSVYHQYLSVDEFRQRFGPTDAQIAAVQASLHAHGLSPGRVSANGLAIPVRSSAGSVARAFAISFERIALPSGRNAFANTQAPQLDGSIAGAVQGVVGLNSLARAHPLALRVPHGRAHAIRHVATGGPQPCSGTTSAAASLGSYTADQIASAYQFTSLYGSGDFGAGENVALVEFEGYFPSDISTYMSCYGISTNVYASQVDGGPRATSRANQDGLETALDVEDAAGLAPGANIHIYQGPSTPTDRQVYDTYNTIISANAEHAISTSWGVCEQADPTFPAAESTLFQEAALQGQSMLAASGDSGSSDCQAANGSNAPAVDDPASQPFVTGVGGTSLQAIGPPPSETVWNDSYGSGGGGVSSLWQRPAYQSGVPGSLNQSNREVPDVSADADPGTGLTIYYAGWNAVAGTSAGGPLFAALTAEANASAACRGTPVGFLNPGLYGSAAHAYSSDFNDVVSGSNDISGSGLYPAGAGYDMASGLGSPQGAQLAASICSPQVSASNPGGSAGNPGGSTGTPVAVAVVYPGNRSGRVGKHFSLQMVAFDNNGGALSYAASGLPGGLTIKPNGLISGTPYTPGSFSVTVTARTGAASGSTRFTLSVAGPTVSRTSLTGIAKRRPRLAFTLSAGAGSPAVKKLQIGLPKGLSFGRSPASGTVLSGSKGKRVKGVKLNLSKGTLVVTLPKALAQLRITIAPPALGASRNLVSAVKHKKVGQLFLTLKPTDARRFTSLLTVTLKKPS